MMIFFQKLTAVLTLTLLHCIPAGTHCVKSKHALRSSYMHTFNETAIAETAYLTLVKEVSPNIAKCVHVCALMDTCVAAEWREEDRTFCRYLQSDGLVHLPRVLEPDALSIITFDGMSGLIVECPLTWTEFKGSCYKYIADFVEFTEARTSCNEQGADLLTFETKEEQDFVIQHFGFSDVVWISLKKNDAGEWKWGDGSDPQFTLWARNEPDAVEKCARVNSNGEWCGNGCGSHIKYKYLCEMELTEY